MLYLFRKCMRSSFKGGSAVASLSHRRANTTLPANRLYMGINIPEVERQKASKALNCDRQCPLWVKSEQTVPAKIQILSALCHVWTLVQ